MAFVIFCACIRVDSVFIGGSIPTTAFDVFKIDMKTFFNKGQDQILHLLLNRWTYQIKTLQVHRSHDADSIVRY